MLICVVATSSHKGGALAVYLQFLSHLETQKGDCQYLFFIDPSMPTKNIDGVEFIQMSLSGIERFLFDLYRFNRILKAKGILPNIIFSLQNTAVVYDKHIPQLIYYHQSLPFFKYHYNLFSKTGRTYFFYHYLYPNYVRFLSHKKVRYVVQTDYIKNCFLERFTHVNEHNIYSFFPDVERIDEKAVPDFEFEEDTFNFFYPASGNEYKEHVTLVYSLHELNRLHPDLIKNIRVHFTLDEISNSPLVSFIENFNLRQQFVFHGNIEHDALLSMMKSSNGLLFPSVIETIGLPMLEAAALGIPVVANDLPFVHSVIDDYEGVTFVKLHDYQQWSKAILLLSKERIRFPALKHKESSWPEVFKLIKKMGV